MVGRAWEGRRGSLAAHEPSDRECNGSDSIAGPNIVHISPFVAFAPPLPRFNTLQRSFSTRPPWREAAYFKVPFRPISDLDKHELAHDYTLCSAILTRPRPGVVLATAFRQQARDLGRRCRVPASKLQLSPSASHFTTTLSCASLFLGTDRCDRVD